MTKPNPENCKKCSSKCAYDCAQLQYTIQNRPVLIISPLTTRQTSQLRCCLSEERGVRAKDKPMKSNARPVRHQTLCSRRTSLPAMTSIKLYCAVIGAHVCKQLARGHYLRVEQLEVEPAACELQVQCLNHYTSRPNIQIRDIIYFLLPAVVMAWQNLSNYHYNHSTAICPGLPG